LHSVDKRETQFPRPLFVFGFAGRVSQIIRKIMSAHQIKAAIRSGDPYAISEVFTLPPLKHAFPSGTTPKPHSSSQNKFHERFGENGLDWSNAINSFLEARDYAAKVRTHNRYHL
jgi:hypothetical protein